MRVVFMGSPEFSVGPLERLVRGGHRVVAVYTRSDRPAGRGRELSVTPVKRAAMEAGLPVVQPEVFESDEIEHLASLEPDVVLVAAYGKILPRAVLEIPHCGCINLHPSLLPRHRGASPVASAILAGDEFTGVSVMSLDEGMDTGPLLMQARIPVASSDTTGSLTEKLSRLSVQLTLSLLSRLQTGDIVSRTQDELQASYCKQVRRADGEIDWNMPAVDIWRRVRAFYPWPVCRTRWQDKQLRIIEGIPLPDNTGVDAGKVALIDPYEATGKSAFCIGTGRGALGVIKLQMEGKRVLYSGDFLKGQPDLAGAQLPTN
ncbi:MAG: methionyl-tRNA formyltransferase [Dehalococcoidales bacterium]